MFSKIYEFIKNHSWALAVVAFVVGGIVTYLFLPERIKIEEKEKIVYKDKIVEKEVIKWKEKIVEKVVEVYKKTYKKTVRIQLPDGTIKEEIIEYSSTEELTRLEESLTEKYNMQLLEKEKEWAQEKSKLIEQTNPRKLRAFAGYNVTKIGDQEYMVGGLYKIWGPINVGVAGTTKGNIFPIIGIEF